MRSFAAVGLAQHGDVIIAAADGYRDVAVAGGQVLSMARNAGVMHSELTAGLTRSL